MVSSRLIIKISKERVDEREMSKQIEIPDPSNLQVDNRKNSYVSCIICRKIILYSKVGNQKGICVDCMRKIEHKHCLDKHDAIMSGMTLLQAVWHNIDQLIEFREDIHDESYFNEHTRNLIYYSFFIEEEREGERKELISYIHKIIPEIMKECLETLNEDVFKIKKTTELK